MLADSVLSRYVCTVRGWLLMVVGNLIGADKAPIGHRREIRRRAHRILSTLICISCSDELQPMETKKRDRNCRPDTCAKPDPEDSGMNLVYLAAVHLDDGKNQPGQIRTWLWPEVLLDELEPQKPPRAASSTYPIRWFHGGRQPSRSCDNSCRYSSAP